MNLIISGDEKQIRVLERELWFRAKKFGFVMVVTEDEEIEDEKVSVIPFELDTIEPIAAKLEVKKPKVELAKHKVKPKGRPAKR